MIDWLKTHVLELLADTVTLAARYDGWLLQLSDELYTFDPEGQGRRRQVPTGQGQEIRAALKKIKAQLGSSSDRLLHETVEVEREC